jgi:hypothetical protein
VLLFSSHIHLLLIFPLIVKLILRWLVLSDATRAHILGTASEKTIVVVLLGKIIFHASKVLVIRLALNDAVVVCTKALKIKRGLVLRQILQVYLIELILHLARGLVVHCLAHGLAHGLDLGLLHLLNYRRFLLHTYFSARIV